MNFGHAGRYFEGESSTGASTVAPEYCKLWVKEITASSWTQLTIPNWFTEAYNYPRTNSGNIDLKDYLGKKIQIKFEYTSNNSIHGTWNVIKLAVTGTKEKTTNTNNETVKFQYGGWYTYTVANDIDVEATHSKNSGSHFIYIYKVPEFTKKKVAFQKLGLGTTASEKVIPAGTPVAVFVDADQANRKYDLVIATTDDQIHSVGNNKLHPSIDGEVMATAQTDYRVLQYDGDTPGFYRLAAGRTVGLANQNPVQRKAYLNMTEVSDQLTITTSSAKGILIWGEGGENGETTGIETNMPATPAKATATRIYNLNGQYVGTNLKALPRGIYIVNGKKICK